MNDKLKDVLDLRELGGELLRIRQRVRGRAHTAIFTGNNAERIHISTGLDLPLLYITTDRNKARELYEKLQEFNPKVGLLVERDDILMYRKMSSSVDNSQRLRTLYGMINGDIEIIVSTSEAVMQYFPSPENILSSVLKLDVDKEYKLENITKSLSEMGYNNVPIVEEIGDFSLGGDIMSIFPFGEIAPIRISFFDETIESIKTYDLSSSKSVGKLNGITLFSPTDPTFKSVDMPSLIAKAKKSIKGYVSHASDRAMSIIGELQSKIDIDSAQGYSWLTPFCHDHMCKIDAFLPSNSVIVFDDPKSIYDHARLYFNDFNNRCNTLILEGEVTPNHLSGVLNIEVFSEIVEKFTGLSFANIASSNQIFAPSEVFRLNNPSVRSYFANFKSIFTDLKNFNMTGYRIVVCAGDEHTARSLVSSLYENNIYANFSKDVSLDNTGVQVTSQRISHGFNYPKSKFILIGTDELVKKREVRKATRRKNTNVFTMPKIGDYVVHDTQGIGVCAGVEQMETFGTKKDFVVINYAESDKLYIPVDQMDKLQRYSGSDAIPKLNRLGGKEFQKLKDRVKESVKEMAFDLLELYRARQNSKGYKYSRDTASQELFENAFEYTETDDQLKATDDIKSDMERGIVMDRLLCGDVGYGKTEVAFRAMYKTYMEGKQSAILAPTTILARQHYMTAKERFADDNIKCVLLSRFQSKQEIKANIELIKSGEAKVIIATHRLLSQDIVFKDIGLLVLDEEQRFGVEHKEKLKLLNDNINVLTLSATPIPRTLNMALTGIRDISVLETPPKERIPVETYVTELTDGLLVDVINREIERDGQVYVLYNRVNDIEKMASRISELVPNAKVIIGHGQMGDTQLEDSINKFYNKEANVLVCTTIIENGINLPDANTLIVCDADRLGLSALYQLRGRVGRSDKHAYAYFTTRLGKVITSDALKRLTAILDYTDFGSGFKIAMRDLEIRGAGNVLGKEQHGHIAKVGYDMYCKLLKEAVDEISGNEVVKGSNVDMSIDVEAYLDSEYISSNDEKIKVYKNIAELASMSELKEMEMDLKDRYGTPNNSLLNLMQIAVIKNMSSRVGAKKVTINSKGMGIEFGTEIFKNESVITAVSDMKDDCVLSISEAPMVVFNANLLDINAKLALIMAFLDKCHV